jgi:NAD(P)-dependent dehydrogenase (short-subunit alcohol dehydrogenase family)
MKEVRGKVAVITGAASGIGRGMAESFAARGMRVVLSDVEQIALESTTDHLRAAGATVRAVVADVSKAKDIELLAEETLRIFGAVHVLCNNAGVGAGGMPSWTSTLDDWNWVIGVNLTGRGSGHPYLSANHDQTGYGGTHSEYCIDGGLKPRRGCALCGDQVCRGCALGDRPSGTHAGWVPTENIRALPWLCQHQYPQFRSQSPGRVFRPGANIDAARGRCLQVMIRGTSEGRLESANCRGSGPRGHSRRALLYFHASGLAAARGASNKSDLER